jgi:hypothetical protein
MERDKICERLAQDLLGPFSDSEVLSSRPSDCYLTGILFPPRTRIAEEEDEDLAGPVNDENTGESSCDSPGVEAVALCNTNRQSSAGLSFAVSLGVGEPSIDFEINCGVYTRCWKDPQTGDISATATQGHAPFWKRAGHKAKIEEVKLPVGMLPPIDLGTISGNPIPGLVLRIQTANSETGRLVTAVLVNNQEPEKGRVASEEASFFQVELRAKSGPNTKLVARPSRRSGEDPSSALIYRDCVEYAVGHTCSAKWTTVKGEITEVSTTWLPEQIVPAVSPEGDPAFDALDKDPKLKPRLAEWLVNAKEDDLFRALSILPDCYGAWLDAQERRVRDLPTEFQTQASRNIAECRLVAQRMRNAVHMIANRTDPKHDPHALQAFRYANLAMSIQRDWALRESGRKSDKLVWRPFQLGFQLLALSSLADRSHPERSLMDLLWFPTGGGKTEAYLGLAAFTLFYRRLRHGEAKGAGVAVIMRYTLRLLTIQQFQRAATLIAACEYLRRKEPDKFGQTPFSLGLWVGSGATPNNIKDAAEHLQGFGDSTPKQLLACPVCQKQTLKWYCLHRCSLCNHEGELDSGKCRNCQKAPGKDKRHKPTCIRVNCTEKKCEFGGAQDPSLPLWTVDEDVYREKPSILIGTVDKFTQIARKHESRVIFGEGGIDPPDLIIQDELHLISGPLGTMTALYEVAVDELCSGQLPNGTKSRPKVIGSTATIRAATEQIRQLFNRGTSLFPPPALDAVNSCFAKVDLNRPGRKYVGVTTAGRSPKFSLQAVYASALQSASALPANDGKSSDPYWTLVGYFNSLRELGGALVMTRDDVPASIVDYARRHEENPRDVNSVDELTSRKTSREIPEVLDRLSRGRSDEASYDVILATNMLSVGVDIPRLGIMVVNGQPKQVAEYIQSTSRVGREHPGLVLCVYNNGRARDRSFYETFASWHSSLYRDVEATGVTPFAPRAADKALHAVLVILVRHLVKGMATTPKLTSTKRADIEKEVIPLILDRVKSADDGESDEIRGQLRRLLDDWENRCSAWQSDPGIRPDYWKETKPEQSLLVSAEAYAREIAAGMPGIEAWPTPNSMRDVEPGSPFKLVNRL